ncbi:hypothetical protein [Amycolatopsis sp. CA-128772]|nr:hypothetical protein [Amycolatopsis sp. CA-128772]
MTGGSFTAREAAYDGGDVKVVAPDLQQFLHYLRDELRSAMAG